MISERLYSFIVIGFYGILEPELELFEIKQSLVGYEQRKRK